MGAYKDFRAFLFGKPLKTAQLSHERLPKWKALAVFASDALSSVAYATQEILIPLALAGAAVATGGAQYVNWSLPIALAITTLMVLVSFSYFQTIRAYPKGGGAYMVVRENLGTNPSLVTAAALLIDYVLTVAVSASAGVEAITSAFPSLVPIQILLCVIAISIVTMINLRGVRESGSIFSIPTHVFIVSFLMMIGWGTYRYLAGDLAAVAPVIHETYPPIDVTLVMLAFASGCAALTGIEAISDGVLAFRPPEARNAQITLSWMLVILATLFLSITAFAHLLGVMPGGSETVVSKIARMIFGGGPFYYLVQFSTAMILFLAANTAFADFPRVCSFLANDRFLPRQLASLGDRLVFSKGILILGMFSAALAIVFKGHTHSLIPLYAVGVFISFTLSQSGMVRYHLKHREKGWRYSICFNLIGAITTFCVLLVIAYSKFSHGAWVVLVLIPIFITWFRATREHYRKASVQLTLPDEVDLKMGIKNTVVLPISGVHRGVIDAIKYSKSISKDVRAVYVELDAEQTERLRQTWKKLHTGIQLVVLPSPYRSVVTPIIDYIRSVEREHDDDVVTIVIPEFVTARWWEGIYHNQTAFLIRTALLFERGKVVTTVRYHLKR